MEKQTPQKEMHEKTDIADIMDSEFWPRFWIIEGSDETKPLSKLNPFAAEKALKGISPSFPVVQRLRDGTLLIECDKVSQANSLRRTTQLASVPVKVSPHRSKNSSQGIIRCRDIYEMTEEEIQQELASQGISHVRRFVIKREGHLMKTNNYLLTFNRTALPSSINVGYLRVKVELYIPNPLRCYKCQKFGHGQNSCKGQLVCFKCGSPEHEVGSCTGPLKCVNCAGNHASNSKQCSVWLKECAIQKLKAEQKVTYPEAKRQVEATEHRIPNRGSYAAVATHHAKSPVQTVSIETLMKSCLKSLSKETSTTPSTQKESEVKSNGPPSNSAGEVLTENANPKKDKKDKANSPADKTQESKHTSSEKHQNSQKDNKKEKLNLLGADSKDDKVSSSGKSTNKEASKPISVPAKTPPVQIERHPRASKGDALHGVVKEMNDEGFTLPPKKLKKKSKTG